MKQAQIHFIGGEKGGVGKSVVARLLAQYWIDQDAPWRGFDTDRSHGALLRYYSDFSVPLKTDRIDDLDTLVESAMEEGGNFLVDLAAQTEDALHHWVDDAGVLELAGELGVGMTFWYVMDDGKDSLNLLARFLDRHGEDARYVVVHNHGRGDDFSLFRSSPVAARIADMDIPIVDLRALHRPTMRKIDAFDKSFWAAVNNSDPALGECLSLMERQRVKVWLKQAYSDFARVGA